MAEINGFYKPDLTLTCSGKTHLYNMISVNSSEIGLLLKIDFLGKPTLSKGDIVSGDLMWKKNTSDLLFTCVVTDVVPIKNNTYRIVGREEYFNLMKKPLPTTSWRNTTLRELLEDLFQVIGINKYDITNCPDLDISRFSIVEGNTGFNALNTLSNMAKFSNGFILSWQPYPDGSLVYGETKLIRQEMSKPIIFESSVNIISRDENRVKAFALPVLSNQEISINGIDTLCLRSRISITPGKYRIEMEGKPL